VFLPFKNFSEVQFLTEIMRQVDCLQAVLQRRRMCSHYKNGNVKLFYDFLTLKVIGICYKR